MLAARVIEAWIRQGTARRAKPIEPRGLFILQQIEKTWIVLLGVGVDAGGLHQRLDRTWQEIVPAKKCRAVISRLTQGFHGPHIPTQFFPHNLHRVVPDGVVDLDQADVVHAVVFTRQAFADDIRIQACHELIEHGTCGVGKQVTTCIPRYLKSPRSFHTVFSWQ